MPPKRSIMSMCLSILIWTKNYTQAQTHNTIQSWNSFDLVASIVCVCEFVSAFEPFYKQTNNMHCKAKCHGTHTATSEHFVAIFIYTTNFSLKQIEMRSINNYFDFSLPLPQHQSPAMQSYTRTPIFGKLLQCIWVHELMAGVEWEGEIEIDVVADADLFSICLGERVICRANTYWWPKCRLAVCRSTLLRSASFLFVLKRFYSRNKLTHPNNRNTETKWTRDCIYLQLSLQLACVCVCMINLQEEESVRRHNPATNFIYDIVHVVLENTLTPT